MRIKAFSHNPRASSLLVAILLCLAQAGYAGDEDMNPSLYQRFDPETGYMVPVDPATVQKEHQPVEADAQTGRPEQSESTTGPAEEKTQSPLYWIAAVAGLLVIGGFLIRRKKVS